MIQAAKDVKLVPRPGEALVGTIWHTPMCLWGPSIPPQSKLANRVQGCMTHSCSREVQSIHVRCAGNCRVVFWRNNHILGIHRFQEESQNWHEYRRQYLVATLLKNALVCCYGSQVSQYFDLPPPKLEEYFHLK